MSELIKSTDLRDRLASLPPIRKARFGIHKGLDDVLDGIEAGEIITIAAMPGSGKTSLCISMTKDLAKDYKCLWFSCEMGPQAFFNMFGEDIPLFYLPEEMKNFGTTREMLAWLEGIIREAKETVGVDVIFLDHLQYLTNLSSDRTTQMVDFIMRWLKTMVIKYDVTLFLITHIDKDSGKEERRPSLASMRGSQMIAGESSTVLIIQRLKEKQVDAWGEHPWSTKSRIYVEKNRRTGNLGHITMQYDKDARIFNDIEELGQPIAGAPIGPEIDWANKL